ncbi:putative trypsin-like serine protease, partial [Trypoxylus dichotomus]
MASLHVEGDEPWQTKWGECAGSLISETFVVTAAHCVVRVDNKEPVMVRLGKVDLLGDTDHTPPQNIRIQEVIVHPGYKHTEKLNDIALLRLAKPAEFSIYVKPVCLNTDPYIQGQLTVAGWGFTNVT